MTFILLKRKIFYLFVARIREVPMKFFHNIVNSVKNTSVQIYRIIKNIYLEER